MNLTQDEKFLFIGIALAAGITGIGVLLFYAALNEAGLYGYLTDMFLGTTLFISGVVAVVGFCSILYNYRALLWYYERSTNHQFPGWYVWKSNKGVREKRKNGAGFHQGYRSRGIRKDIERWIIMEPEQEPTITENSMNIMLSTLQSINALDDAIANQIAARRPQGFIAPLQNIRESYARALTELSAKAGKKPEQPPQ
jgi:hypothetical protein